MPLSQVPCHRVCWWFSLKDRNSMATKLLVPITFQQHDNRWHAWHPLGATAQQDLWEYVSLSHSWVRMPSRTSTSSFMDNATFSLRRVKVISWMGRAWWMCFTTSLAQPSKSSVPSGISLMKAKVCFWPTDGLASMGRTPRHLVKLGVNNMVYFFRSYSQEDFQQMLSL